MWTRMSRRDSLQLDRPAESRLHFGEPAERARQEQWFDFRYDHFSIDSNWFAPNGTSLLSLRNVYVKFK